MVSRTIIVMSVLSVVSNREREIDTLKLFINVLCSPYCHTLLSHYSSVRKLPFGGGMVGTKKVTKVEVHVQSTVNFTLPLLPVLALFSCRGFSDSEVNWVLSVVLTALSSYISSHILYQQNDGDRLRSVKNNNPISRPPSHLPSVGPSYRDGNFS